MFDLPSLINRREFVRLMGAAVALAATGCARRPLEPVVPYLSGLDAFAAGDPSYFATALTCGGYAHGVLVESNAGRPTKIEGNPSHPASLGATGPMEQGRVLELWDPDRSRTVLDAGAIATWDALQMALVERTRRFVANGGAGLRLLTRAVSSPTLLRQLGDLQTRYPNMRWHHYEPINRDQVHAGTRMTFGRTLEPVYRFENARVVVALDADFLGTLPGHVRYARDFARNRDPDTGVMSRLYAAECMPTITGATADRRCRIRTGDVAATAAQIAQCIADRTITSGDGWVDAALNDLRMHPRESLVIAGDAQPPAVHALVFRVNAALGNIGHTLDFIAPPVATDTLEGQSLDELVPDMRSDHVDTLLILGGNPVYDAPADFEFAAALAHVPLSIHCGLYVDETALACRWHIPETHELEAWSDARAFDGTITIQQPLIAPLYGGHSVHEVVAVLANGTGASAYDLVRDTWRAQFGDSFPGRFDDALRSGLVVGTAHDSEDAIALSRAARVLDLSEIVSRLPKKLPDDSVELGFRADANVWDGRYANVPWLQELPRPMTQLTWDNAALMSPAFAATIGVANEDVVELSCDGRTLAAPVWIVPAHAERSVTLHFGGGRTAAGRVGNGCGVDAYRLRTSQTSWCATGLEIRRQQQVYPLASVQRHHTMQGRDIVRRVALREFKDSARITGDMEPPAESIYGDAARDGYAWGMSIDLTACIGCNACTIACQAENNIPSVGKDQVRLGREMHWIRVDHYSSDDDERHTDFQPVPCMQCEHAPCEIVCPVEASVHDTEGINVQVYNRCVGTRFCSNNCPYKVRRFNFLKYNRDEPSLDAQRNPEVTVRGRGVMEKCNYCLQRVVRARIVAERENRTLQDGEVVTACQSVCPTQAITFGDLNDATSRVRAKKTSPRNYTLLRELNTRPRTTYLAKIVNANDDKGS